MDDGSTDKSVENIPTYPNIPDKRTIKVIRLIKNQGECSASDTGFRSASGKYTCRLSADDYFIRDDHIEKQVKEMDRTGADWCYNTITDTGASCKIPTTVYSKWLIHPVFDNLILKFPSICRFIISKRNPVNSSALMFRADAYWKHSLAWSIHKTRYGCDLAILDQALNLGLKGLALHEKGSFYRIHSGQLSNNPEFIKEMERRRSR